MNEVANTGANEFATKNQALRYAFEHIALPRLFYAKTDELLSDLLTGRGVAVVKLYKIVRNNKNWKPPFKASDFTVTSHLYDFDGDACLIVDLKMQKPVKRFDCRNIYLCSSQKSGKALYFTSELSEEGPYLLGAWTSTEKHMNFGESQTQGEVDRVAQLYKDLLINGNLDALLCAIM